MASTQGLGGWHQLAKMAATIAQKGERVQKAASTPLCCTNVGTNEVSILSPPPLFWESRASERAKKRKNGRRRERDLSSEGGGRESLRWKREGRRRFFARGIQIGSIESWGTKGGSGAELEEKGGSQGSPQYVEAKEGLAMAIVQAVLY